MKILAIDTTSPSGSVALLEDRAVLRAMASAAEQSYSSRLQQDVERVIVGAGVGLPQVELFAVAAGPGSFTGVRVGLAAVKAWAEVYKRPVAAVSALEAIAAQVESHIPMIAAITDAHRGQLFAGLYTRAGAPETLHFSQLGEDVVLPAAECMAYLFQHAAGKAFVIRTTATEMVRAAAAASAPRAVPIETADPLLAPAIGLLALSRAQRGELGDALTLDAHYVRRSDAELLWKPN